MALIGCQLLLAPLSQSARADVPATGAERELLETVLTLKGLALSERELATRLPRVIERYKRVAPADGREARLQAALVELGVLTPQQARKFATEAKLAQARLTASAPGASSEAQEQAALQAQIEVLSGMSLNGAQFAGGGSMLGCVAGTLSLLGGIGLLIWGSELYGDNPTCHEDHSKPYSCREEACDRDGEWCHWVETTCYETKCDQPDYYPDRPRGQRLMIGGGVALGVGILLLVLNVNDCD
ncbi:MAG TPA: hypothetical protein VM598_00325 [Bdellovibrionota bacterium]|nr:hypothetical protein [Bdellovibrionota bacterium]